jgi:RNAse (barnase) inhibitor barstar
MSLWLDINEAFPGLQGDRIHIVNVAAELLAKALLTLGFKIYTIDGSKISDEKSFFDEAARALEFPTYFGRNWNAWSDCLGDFGRFLSVNKVAIIWEHADRTLTADTQIFLEAVCDLSNLALSAALNPMQHSEVTSKQIEVFLLGQGEGFNVQLALENEL